MALIDIVDSIVPGWAKSRPHWWKAFRLAAVLVDALIEGVYTGRRAGMPNAIEGPGVVGWGGFEDPKSPERIGHDLGVLHGLVETIPAYSYRLRHAQDAAAGGWTAPPILGLFEQLAGVLGPTPPLMRIVYLDSSDWWTRETTGVYRLQRAAGDGVAYNLDGTTTPDTTAAVVVDWDSTTSPPPPDKGFKGRWLLILYLPLNTPYGTTTPDTFNTGCVLGHLWNSHTATGPDPGPWASTFGTNSPHALVALVSGVVKQRECAGLNDIWIVVATDPDSFNPDGSSSAPAYGSAYPDGTWGWDTKHDPATTSRIISRNPTAEYWKMPQD